MRGVTPAAAGLLWRIAQLPAQDVKATLRAFVRGLMPVRFEPGPPRQLLLELPDLTPTDTVRCEPLTASLRASVCVQRHTAVTPSGNGKGYPIHPSCFNCLTGEHRRELLKLQGWEPRAHQTFNIARQTAAAHAFVRLVREGAFDPTPTCDGLPTEVLR